MGNGEMDYEFPEDIYHLLSLSPSEISISISIIQILSIEYRGVCSIGKGRISPVCLHFPSKI